jgi:HPt (histidine-containing phosphotransfer) domain-containing protein
MGPSRSEQMHLDRMNRRAPRFFAASVPLVALLAWKNGTGLLPATELTVALAAVSWLVTRSKVGPRAVSVVHGVAAMGLAALLAHFGRGPLAPDMDVAFFVLLPVLVVFVNPLVIVVAAIAAAASGLLHGVHLGFLALETVACSFVARSFFDNLAGLEKTVRTRTVEIERKTRDLELFLETVDQGFVTLTASGAIVASSAAFARTFEGDRTDTFFERLERKDPTFAESSRAAWEQVEDGVLPAPMALAQMPARLVSGERVFSFQYRAVPTSDAKLFVAVVSDITSELARETAEMEKREGVLLVQRALAPGERATVTSFLAEGRRIVEQLGTSDDAALLLRAVHTLKGNAAVLGIASVADACHTLETRLSSRPEAARSFAGLDALPVIARFRALEAIARPLLDAERARSGLRDDELARLELLARHGTDRAARSAVLAALAELRLEPVQAQLDHLGEHARDLAARLGRAPLAVTVEAHDARMNAHDSGTFWSAFVHLVHNAVDHGIETVSERQAFGKDPTAQLHLRAGEERGSVFVEIEDDGRGIDWERVLARARELGLPALASQQEALFADGVSTAARIDDLSGRGIGMGAVRAAVHGLHGALTVHSDAGKGTRIRATLPLA